MALNQVTLDDKYDLAKSRIFVTGFQAIVRLCLMQKERDRRAGLNTAGYVTGYRGSPLGTLDQQFIRAQRALDKYDVHFQAGLNEDIAATAIWGSQQAELRGEGRFDGVFGLWYGKGPGVDRTGDVFRHANFAGTSKHGGVLALMGDDHTAESSTTAHQSEYHFIDVMIPILNPAGVQEILDYGLYGWAMSRFCGTWVALKSMHETVESTAVIDGSLERGNIVIPEDFVMPEGGLNIRLQDTILGQEARLHDYKRDAMLAFVRANKLNKYITSGGRRPKIGIITVGKSYLDVRQALDELGIDEVRCNDLGIRLYKIACPWPISQQDLKQFADGLELIIVVEETMSRSALVSGSCKGSAPTRRSRRALPPSRRRNASWPRRATLRCASHISARAVRTIHRPSCPKACAPMPASAATTWHSGWIARRSVTRRWAERGLIGSAKRPSPGVPMSFRISATAPTIIPATWRSAPPSPRASTLPTKSCSTTRSP